MSYLKDPEMYLISASSKIISKARCEPKHAKQSPKNKAPGTLHFSDVVQISDTAELVTSWKGEIKSS